MKSVLGLMLLATLMASGCNRCSSTPPDSSKAQTPEDPQAALASRGRVVYQANCTACHNAHPKQAGSLGPDVFGSSRELLEARVLKAAYPPGYKPKRTSKVMAALPHLKNDIDALHSYLNRAD